MGRVQSLTGSSNRAKPPLITNEHFEDGIGDVGHYSDPKSDPRPEGLGYASGGGGASNRQGNVRVVEENKASQEEENDRLRMSNASYFYKISYNVYGELN